VSWVFISDLHLDEGRQYLLRAFESLLEREVQATDPLQGVYILGDLCEVWVGDDDDSELVTRIRAALISISSVIPVFFLPGNRDFLLGENFANSSGIQILEDPCTIKLAGTRILLAHGDAYCTEDHEYQKLREMLRSEQFKSQVLAMTLAERRTLATSMREESARKNANKASNIMDVSPADISRAFIKHEVSHFIHGHTHRPGTHIETINGEKKVRYVLGDWGACGWLLRFDGKVFQMECFSTSKLPS